MNRQNSFSLNTIKFRSQIMRKFIICLVFMHQNTLGAQVLLCMPPILLAMQQRDNNDNNKKRRSRLENNEYDEYDPHADTHADVRRKKEPKKTNKYIKTCFLLHCILLLSFVSSLSYSNIKQLKNSSDFRFSSLLLIS